MKLPIELKILPTLLDEKIVDETNTYIAKIGYDIKFNKNEMIEMLELYINPPLKFEELKGGHPYWDNKFKEWCYVSVRYPKDRFVEVYIFRRPPIHRCREFEENRFFLREVKE